MEKIVQRIINYDSDNEFPRYYSKTTISIMIDAKNLAKSFSSNPTKEAFDAIMKIWDEYTQTIYNNGENYFMGGSSASDIEQGMIVSDGYQQAKRINEDAKALLIN